MSFQLTRERERVDSFIVNLSIPILLCYVITKPHDKFLLSSCPTDNSNFINHFQMCVFRIQKWSLLSIFSFNSQQVWFTSATHFSRFFVFDSIFLSLHVLDWFSHVCKLCRWKKNGEKWEKKQSWNIVLWKLTQHNEHQANHIVQLNCCLFFSSFL